MKKEWCDSLIRYSTNIGANAVYHRWMKNREDWWGGSPPEYLCFIHSDLLIRDEGWDVRVVEAFDRDPKLGLLGFVGSPMIDPKGGRGYRSSTRLNFVGATYKDFGKASGADEHGVRNTGLIPAANLDHCAMVFRTSVLEKVTPQEGNLVLEHFTDRTWCCEVLEMGFHVAYLGIACDHLSGGIRGGAAEATKLRKKWLTENGIPFDDTTDVANLIYLESEKRFLAKWRDQKKFIPLRVGHDYSLTHEHPDYRLTS